jgi:hypothetical protein
MLGQLGLSAKACQNNLVGGGEIVQDLQLVERKPPRDDQDAKWDEEDDEHRESDGRQRMRDGNACSDPEQLQPDVERDFALPDLEKRLVSLYEPLLALQEDDFVEDAVGFDRAPLGIGL